MLAKTRQAFLLPDHPAPKPLPEPGLRSKEQDEPEPASKPLRRLLRRFLVRDVQVWRAGGGRGVRQQ
jgi:hypothetical protein